MAAALKPRETSVAEDRSRGDKSKRVRRDGEDIRPWLTSALGHAALLLVLAIIASPRAKTELHYRINTTVAHEEDSKPAIRDVLYSPAPVDIAEEQQIPEGTSAQGGAGVVALSSRSLVLDPGTQILSHSLTVPDGLARPMPLASIPNQGNGARGRTQNGSRNGLAGLLNGRGDGMRGRLVVAYGGTEASERAVALGLDWLARHQNPDGSWSLDRFGQICNGLCDGYGVQCDTAGTGLGVLPFLAAGHTQAAGTYQKVVKKALDWLVAHQHIDGSLIGNDHIRVRMYGHGIASIALCEAYGMTENRGLRTAAQRAIDFITKAQDPEGGGWRYTPGERGDTSVAGWQVMALATGRMADLTIAPDVASRASLFLDSMGRSTYIYHRPTHALISPAMTAEALLCRVFLGWSHDHPSLREGVRWLLHTHPPTGVRDVYYWYYGTQLMHQVGGDPWTRWNPALRDLLVDTQIKVGHSAGSWDPMRPKPDAWGHAGGRVYVTSLSLLTLEAYYRHLPIYDGPWPTPSRRRSAAQDASRRLTPSSNDRRPDMHGTNVAK